MNETLQVFKTRRCVRAYRPEQIPANLLEQVLEAGTFAPTGSGRQSPIILVVQDHATIAQLSRLNAAVMDADTDPFYGAPTVLIVMADRNASTCVQDGSAVLTNLLNAAHAVGLDSCWVHRAKEELESEAGKALLKKWGVDEKYVGIGHCILGYAATTPGEAAPRKKDYIVRV
ncbi:MAG: nitroreductase [Clostridia bacterium]